MTNISTPIGSPHPDGTHRFGQGFAKYGTPTHSRPVEAATEPGEANAVEGLVVLDGPGAVAATLTADAADAMADRLHRAAEEARRS